MLPELKLDYIYIGDVFTELKKIPSAICRCAVTSVPYWGLRNYQTGLWVNGDVNCDHSRATNIVSDATHSTTKSGGMKSQLENHKARKQYKNICGKCGAIYIDDQIGLESRPEDYIKKIVLVFREVKRILTGDGTLWLNIGDSYFGGKGASGDARPEIQQQRVNNGKSISRASQSIGEKGKVSPLQGRHEILKPKDLCGMPWRLAFALQADGWWLRNDIIWQKPNPMPGSMTDRCTVNHEYIFLLTKSPKYYFDQVAIRQPLAQSVLNDKRYWDDKYETGRPERNFPGQASQGAGLLKRKSGNIERKYGSDVGAPEGNGKHQGRSIPWEGETANKKTVWTVAAKGFNGEYCKECGRYYSGTEKSLIRKEEVIIDSKKVRRSYCLCGRHDGWVSHFAVFPQKLIIDCLKAGSSDYGQCADCGSPWVRITEKTLKPTIKAVTEDNQTTTIKDNSGSEYDQGSNYLKTGYKRGHYNEFITKGWQPSCECHGHLKKNVIPQEPTPIYDEDNPQEIINYEQQDYEVFYTYEPYIPLQQHPVKPDVVLDCFMGAGTTALVAKKLHRNFIGVEINKDYVAMSHKRLEKELGMFYTPPNSEQKDKRSVASADAIKNKSQQP